MSVQVLIADGDQKRAQRIAEACRASGLTCQVTSHGAAALEAALAELPAVLVAQLDLPLIDGPKLAAILRANPRTQPTRLLFVSERAEAAARKDLPGRLIAAPVDADEVASAVRALVGNLRWQRPRRRRRASRAARSRATSRRSRSPTCSSSSR